MIASIKPLRNCSYYSFSNLLAYFELGKLLRNNFLATQKFVRHVSLDARDLIERCDELKNVAPKVIESKFNAFASAGIPTKFISDNPQLLLKSTDTVLYMIKQLRDVNISETNIPFMLVWRDVILKKCLNTCRKDLTKQSEHRIQFFVGTMKLSEHKIIEWLKKYPFIFSLSYAQVREATHVLLQYDVKPEDIMSDPWVLRCKANIIKSRIERVEDTDVESKKPWMARCTNDVFERFITRVSTKQKLLGESSLEEYLSRRLDCRVVDIKEIIDREPQLQKTSVMKIKKILDFLFTSGFISSQIIAGLPRVANRRIETIHTRLLESNQLGIPPSLYVLCKSEREYRNYIKKWKNREN